MRYGNGMHAGMGIRFSMNSAMKNLLGYFPVILLVPVLGCLCTQKINCSKTPVTQNSVTQRIPGKMPDQYC